MPRHPEGLAHTARLLELAGLTPPCRVLDAGAGEGDTLRYLRALGFDALGVDLAPGPDVEAGDLLACPWPDGSFDAVISECALFVTGCRSRALEELYRLLRPGGLLLLSDVFFGGPGGMTEELTRAGFSLLDVRDATEDWKKYYIRQVWEGTAEELCSAAPKGKCRYYLTVSEKEEH